MVKTICYGREETWEDRELAVRQFMEWACGSEGSERERYTNVLLKLMDGQEVCSDE